MSQMTFVKIVVPLVFLAALSACFSPVAVGQDSTDPFIEGDGGAAHDGGAADAGHDGGAPGDAGDQSTADDAGVLPASDAGDQSTAYDAGVLPASDASTGQTDGAVPGDGRRLPLPCEAPLPTGFCLTSVTGGTRAAGGPSSVTLSGSYGGAVSLQLQDNTGYDSSADFAPPEGGMLAPGLFSPAERYPFHSGTAAGMDVGGGCNTLVGTFAVEELAREPVKGITRFSVTFTQRCDGSNVSLNGVINYQATGTPDPTPTPDRIVNLNGKVSRVAYDPTHHQAFGIDATNRALAKIDLTSGSVTYANVVQIPNDLCVDAARERLFVVNKGSSLISEYKTEDLSSVREITWSGQDWGPTDTHFKIYCAQDKVYVVDGAWAPGLFTIEGLDGGSPQVVDHTTAISGVGGLVLDAAATNLYYWYQYGWSAGLLSTRVRRLNTAAGLAQIDDSGTGIPAFNRDPLDAPALLDESRGLLFVKNKIFDSRNLTRVLYTLPSSFDTFHGASENAYALDPAHGLMATKNYVYELGRYAVVAETLSPFADQLFFDKDGTLWLLSTAKNTLSAQVITH